MKINIYNKGFTLIEIIFVVFIFLVLALGVVELVSSVFIGGGKQDTLLANADQARRVSFQIVRELRNATVSNTGAYALSSADDQDLVFYSNIDGGLDIERVHYFINGTNLNVGILKPVGNPLNYTGSETVYVVQNNVANEGMPVFYYYPGDYDGTTNNALSTPANVTLIKYVKIELSILNKGGRNNNAAYTVTSGTTIRNLKNNLDQ